MSCLCLILCSLSFVLTSSELHESGTKVFVQLRSAVDHAYLPDSTSVPGPLLDHTQLGLSTVASRFVCETFHGSKAVASRFVCETFHGSKSFYALKFFESGVRRCSLWVCMRA